MNYPGKSKLARELGAQGKGGGGGGGGGGGVGGGGVRDVLLDRVWFLTLPSVLKQSI